MMSPITGKKMKVGRIKKDYILLYMEGMMSEARRGVWRQTRFRA